MASRLCLSLAYLMVCCCFLTTVRAATLVCREEGRFPHPEDCTMFLDCLATHSGSLVAREGNCHGYPFSAERKRCIARSEMPDCVSKRLMKASSIPEFDYLCAKGPSVTGCGNCKLPFYCINGVPIVDMCDKNTVCQDTPAFGGPVCLFEPQEDDCKCTKTGLTSDPFNTTYYHYCDKSMHFLFHHTYSCGYDKIFSDKTQRCEDKPQVPACVSPGTFVNPNDCSLFYTCLPDGSVITGSCQENEYFVEASGDCQEKCVLAPDISNSMICADIGNFPHPTGDCTKYIVCLQANNEVAEEKFCPSKLYFNSDLRRCSDTSPGPGCNVGFNYYTCPGHTC